MTKARNPDSQINRFRETARELGCDQSEESFNAALKKVARHRPVDRVADELNQLIDKGDPESMERIAEKLGTKPKPRGR